MDNLQNSTTNNSSDHLKTGQNLNTNVKAPTHSAVSSYRDGYKASLNLALLVHRNKTLMQHTN